MILFKGLPVDEVYQSSLCQPFQLGVIHLDLSAWYAEGVQGMKLVLSFHCPFLQGKGMYQLPQKYYLGLHLDTLSLWFLSKCSAQIFQSLRITLQVIFFFRRLLILFLLILLIFLVFFRVFDHLLSLPWRVFLPFVHLESEAFWFWYLLLDLLHILCNMKSIKFHICQFQRLLYDFQAWFNLSEFIS